MPDRRRDEETRDRLEAIQAGYERWARISIWLLVAQVAILLAFGLLGAYLIGQHAARIGDIQQSREDAIRTSCTEQNSRNGTAFVFLKALPPTPGRPKLSKREQEKLIHGFTDAIVGPVRNCERRVKELTSK
jgi:hypothetical protein